MTDLCIRCAARRVVRVVRQTTAEMRQLRLLIRSLREE